MVYKLVQVPGERGFGASKRRNTVETTIVIAALKVVGYGLGTLGPGIGLGLCGYGLCVGSARQPELAGKLFTNALIFGALAEALALIGFVLTFIF